jgi:hypothetical protein
MKALLAPLACAACVAAQAQDSVQVFPTYKLRLMVPFKPETAVDRLSHVQPTERGLFFQSGERYRLGKRATGRIVRL